MDKYGDPEWKYHVTIAKIWSLLAARLVESPIIPFSAATYATKLQSYLGGVHEKCSPVWTSDDCTSLLRPVADALASLVGVATFFDSRAEQLRVELGRRRIPWWKWWEKWRLYAKVRAVNAGYRGLERQFLHQPGLDRRPWFKHIVFAPGYWTGYSGAVFPGIAEGLESEDWESTRRWVGVVQTAVQRATAFLDSI